MRPSLMGDGRTLPGPLRAFRQSPISGTGCTGLTAGLRPTGVRAYGPQKRVFAALRSIRAVKTTRFGHVVHESGKQSTTLGESVEQLGMRASSLECDHASLVIELVDQQPVAAEVALPMASKVPRQSVVPAVLREVLTPR